MPALQTLGAGGKLASAYRPHSKAKAWRPPTRMTAVMPSLRSRSRSVVVGDSERARETSNALRTTPTSTRAAGFRRRGTSSASAFSTKPKLRPGSASRQPKSGHRPRSAGYTSVGVRRTTAKSITPSLGYHEHTSVPTSASSAFTHAIQMDTYKTSDYEYAPDDYIEIDGNDHPTTAEFNLSFNASSSVRPITPDTLKSINQHRNGVRSALAAASSSSSRRGNGPFASSSRFGGTSSAHSIYDEPEKMHETIDMQKRAIAAYQDEISVLKNQRFVAEKRLREYRLQVKRQTRNGTVSTPGRSLNPSQTGDRGPLGPDGAVITHEDLRDLQNKMQAQADDQIKLKDEEIKRLRTTAKMIRLDEMETKMAVWYQEALRLRHLLNTGRSKQARADIDPDDSQLSLIRQQLHSLPAQLQNDIIILYKENESLKHDNRALMRQTIITHGDNPETQTSSMPNTRVAMEAELQKLRKIVKGQKSENEMLKALVDETKADVTRKEDLITRMKGEKDVLRSQLHDIQNTVAHEKHTAHLNDKARIIQSEFRKNRVRRRKKEYEEQNKAAMSIQNAFRSSVGRRKRRNDRQEELLRQSEAAKIIQSHVRGMNARKKIGSKTRARHKAATSIQASFRGRRVRNALHHAKFSNKYEVITGVHLQSSSSKPTNETDSFTREEATQKIIAFFRAQKYRLAFAKKSSLEIDDMKAARFTSHGASGMALQYLQGVFRGHLARQKFVEQQGIQITDIVRPQRRHHTRGAWSFDDSGSDNNGQETQFGPHNGGFKSSESDSDLSPTISPKRLTPSHSPAEFINENARRWTPTSASKNDEFSISSSSSSSDSSESDGSSTESYSNEVVRDGRWKRKPPTPHPSHHHRGRSHHTSPKTGCDRWRSTNRRSSVDDDYFSTHKLSHDDISEMDNQDVLQTEESSQDEF